MAVHVTYVGETEYYASDLIQREADWICPGCLNILDLVVTAGSGLSVIVSGAPQGQVGGNAWISGGYRFYNDSAATITLATADSTNPRIDLIIAAVDTTQTPYVPVLRAITGTPSGSPVVPSVPAGIVALALAQVSVAANATTVTSGNITDVRTYAGLQGDGSRLLNLPIKVAAINEEQVTVTTGQTILTFTPTVNGNFLIGTNLRVITGSTTVAVTVSYHDVTGSQTYTILASGAKAVGTYPLALAFINAISGYPITVQVTASVANQVYASGTILKL